MKKLISTLLILILFSMIGWATTENQDVDDVSGATPEGVGWTITLTGVRSDTLWQSDVELWKSENPLVSIEMELEKKGVTNLYSGVLLKEIIALVDDPSGAMPAEFKNDLWTEGYDVTLTASDGYSATFNTAEVSPEDVLFVLTIDNESVPPMIAGNVSGKAWVRDLSEIELSLAPVDLTENSFMFELEINGINAAYTIAELEAMDIYVEDKGSFTNSHDNTTDSVYGGVRLVALLSEHMEVTEETAIKIIAMDGYEMSYGGDMLLDQADGDWILAFKENGEYMPEDPGYIRLVKVGPQNPNITGHVSARMIQKITTEGKPFENFELMIVQNDKTEVFDRQTMQSGIITNKNRVSYYDKKSEMNIEYMGISLWRLLERPTGYRAVTIEATDGYSITLSNEQIELNDDVILAMYTGDDELLSDNEWPLRLVWDKDASVVPDGIKAVRNVVKITLVY